MIKNKICIRQNIVCQENGCIRNEYHFGDEWAYFGGLLFPSDGRYHDDEDALEEITHELAVRWGFITSSKKHVQRKLGKIGLVVKQSQSVFHFETVRGHYLGYLEFPADNQHLENMLTLEQIAFTLAVRWGVIRTNQKK